MTISKNLFSIPYERSLHNCKSTVRVGWRGTGIAVNNYTVTQRLIRDLTEHFRVPNGWLSVIAECSRPGALFSVIAGSTHEGM